jgi:hypothetical protein
MSFYPQIGSGVVTQFPFRRTRQWRAIVNQLESGELITLPDLAGGQIGWSLKYEDISSTEAQAIGGLFNASQGKFGAFTFIDPMANLLGWSEDFTRAGWALGELGMTAGIADPLGTQRASTITNGSPGTLQLSQTLGISGDYVACFSAYVRADSSVSIAMQRDGLQAIAPAGPQWTRMLVSGTGSTGAAQTTFSIAIPAGQAVDVWGLQVEVQPWPSVYKLTAAAGGIYEETYFGDDQLTITSTGLGLSRASVNLISRI